MPGAYSVVDALWDCGRSERSDQLMLFLSVESGPAIPRHVSGNMESSAKSRGRYSFVGSRSFGTESVTGLVVLSLAKRDL
jgi:hypothetical protein